MSSDHAAAAAPANPLGRFADQIPGTATTAIAIVATFVAVAAAFVYAYDQDTLFPDRHFPRTWVLVVVMSAVSLLALLPLGRLGASPWWAAFAAGLGAGMLIFGGANLANRSEGIAVVIAGAVVWLAVAAGTHRRGGPVGAAVGGLFASALLTFAVVAFSVLAVSGSA